MFSKNSSRFNEQGVIIPITAIMAFSMLVFLLVVGLNSFVVKRATFDLRDRLQVACQLSSQSERMFIAAEAVGVFQSALEAELAEPIRPFGKVTLDRIHFLFPQLPDFGLHDSIGGTSTGPRNPGPVSFATLTGNSCAGLAGGADQPGMSADCLFYGSVNTFSNVRFPTSLWRNDLEAKTAIGCVAEATVDRIWLADVPIVAVAAFSRPFNGYYPNYFAGETDQTLMRQSMPGFTLAISTHVTTDASDSRFRFSSDFTAKEWYDPFDAYVSGAPTLVPNLHANVSTGMRYSASQALVTPERISANFRSADWTTGTDTDPFGGGLPPGVPSGAILPPDYEEVLSACMNPLLLARNAFLTSLLDYVVRVGRTRSSTEVLHLGTQHRNIANVVDLPTESNAPTIMVPFGVDLLRPDLDPRLRTILGSVSHSHFQLPYIFFHSGTVASPPPTGFGHHKGGYIQGFDTDDVNPAPWMRHQALIASQLRLCYHLYQCEAGLGVSCDESLARYYPSVYNPIVESEDYEQRSRLVQRPITLADGYWEQSCPFGPSARDGSGASSCQAGGGALGDRSGISGLQAPELVGTLGSTQLCPYYHYQSVLFIDGGAAGWCEKPSYLYNASDNVTLDLRPDYLGLVQYLNGSKAGVKSPGIAPLKVSPSLAEPLVSNAYSFTTNTNLPLVLVTHQLPTQAEADAVEAALDSDTAWQTRPIAVVFFPYLEAQLRATNGLDRLRQAFKVDDPDYVNTLFIFDPADAALPRTAAGFRDFWEALIDPSLQPSMAEEHSVAWRALRIFNHLFAAKRSKF